MTIQSANRIQRRPIEGVMPLANNDVNGADSKRICDKNHFG
jgi:hypothetical protein